MGDTKKQISDTYHQAASMHHRLRAVMSQVPNAPMLAQFPKEPGGPRDLREVLDRLRKDIHFTRRALNDWDRTRNGCEIRTREEIQSDIDRDMRLLQSQSPDPLGRERSTIIANVEYDRMQLARS